MISCRFSYMVHLVCCNFGGPQNIFAQGSKISQGEPGHCMRVCIVNHSTEPHLCGALLRKLD